MAHSLFGTVRAAWERTAKEQRDREERLLRENRRSSRPGGGRRPAPRRPMGLRSRRPTGFLEGLWSRVVRIVSNVEELALFILLIAFAGFAVHWLILMLG